MVVFVPLRTANVADRDWWEVNLLAVDDQSVYFGSPGIRLLSGRSCCNPLRRGKTRGDGDIDYSRRGKDAGAVYVRLL